MRSPEPDQVELAALHNLETRIGRLHVRQRLGLEREYEARLLRKGTNFFHLENWYSVHSVIRNSLRLVGLHGRGRRNALAIEVREHEVRLPDLPVAFNGYTILQLSDLHVDLHPGFLPVLIERVHAMEYDLCVLTGDYRARTFGPFAPTLEGLARLRPSLKEVVYAVLGNHDTIRMVPAMEAGGYRVLMNECARITRGDEAIYLAGIDDAHHYHMQDFHRATHDIPPEA
jgi:hypothetical protein